MQTFSVRCTSELAEMVAARVQFAADVETAWRTWRRGQLDATADTEDWSTGELAAARRALAAEHTALRRAGVLRGTPGGDDTGGQDYKTEATR